MDEIVKVATPILEPVCHFAYLLGSAGTEHFNKDSDLDIAIFTIKPLSLEEIQDLNLQLAEAFRREIDLIILNDIDPIFGQQVLETGRLLFANDKTSLLQWKTRQMSQYPDFKQSRAIIEKSLLRRKKYV